MRKKNVKLFAVIICTALTIVGCRKNDDLNADIKTNTNELTATEVALIKGAGLHADGAQKIDNNYLIEGDLLLTAEELRSLSTGNGPELIVANSEQYRTTKIVTGLPRTIRVKYTGTKASVSTALTNAVTRYNAQELKLKFLKVSAGALANITISDVSGVSYIASAGFPTSTGNPHNAIKFNTAYAGWNANTLTSVIAHEIGHCIGYRHTDYMDRSYSCGGAYYNEGAGGIGAIHIPGTPTGPDANSWMLACIGNGTNRPFNTNDKKALNYLY